ncbi:MAG TPA: RDD family protein [Candidatus Nanoarchaeia archaeon]|nr:RDD family protein [Candidatus Nanoarchaeia archaeon]
MALDYGALGIPGRREVITPARIWKRLAAFITDLAFIELVLFFPLRPLTQRIMVDADLKSLLSMISSENIPSAMIALSLAMASLSFLYFVMLELMMGQTVGKLLFHISVTHIDGKSKLLAWQCIVRALLIIPVFPFVLLWVFDPLFALFNANRQRLLESLSRTRTVERIFIH